jgi:serine/threonine protein phosphatase 1
MTVPPRTIAIGDVHGHSAALSSILDGIDPQPEDTIVFLGDYVDHGPDSRGVLEQVIGLSSRCHVVPLMGNHEEMMLGAKLGHNDLRLWFECGGEATLRSYGEGQNVDLIPDTHCQFLLGLPRYYETVTHFFIHANYAPNWRLEQHDSKTALWLPLTDVPGPHYSGKTAVLGHTPRPEGKILDLGHLKCIDTGCGYGGMLSALDVESGEVWQVDENGGRIQRT